MKKAFLYINYNNIVVIKTYLDIVKTALENKGFECKYVEAINSISKESLIVFPMGVDAFKYYLRGYKNIILWQQGATAEESFLRNHSALRFRLLNIIDCYVMKKAKLVLYVSSNLRKYYESKAKCSFMDKSYVMPCFNETIDLDAIEQKDYSKKTFAYVGSLDLWQCFEETVDLYLKIEKKYPTSLLKVLSFQYKEAESILKEKGVSNYIVKSVPKEQVKEELKDVSYGFIIRDDIMVNRVATPTKFSSYLSAGVIPIYSECLEDFTENTRGFSVSFCMGNLSEVDSLMEFIKSRKDREKIEENLKIIFGSYYGVNKHIGNLEKLIGKLL